MKKIILITLINIAFANEFKADSLNCLKHGESGNVGGVPGKSGWILNCKK